MKLIKQVLDYNKAYKINTPEKPKLPPTQLWEARQEALKQELETLHSAWVEKDVNKVALSITDSIYSLVSLACESGLQDYLEACLDELHRSNMSNVDGNGDTVILNGELIQSSSYTPPNINRILDNHAD
ncbi:MAG: hypothetical protein ACTHJ0_11705 [Flavipsychrobacter sp.]